MVSNEENSEGYLKCKKCGGYYELQEGESSEDFSECECGGKFRHIHNQKTKKDLEEGESVTKEPLTTEDIVNNKVKKLATAIGTWGFVFNLFLLSSPLSFITALFFAALIYSKKSFKALYAFAIIYILISLLQIVGSSKNVLGIIAGPLNIIFTVYVLYTTRKLKKLLINNGI